MAKSSNFLSFSMISEDRKPILSCELLSLQTATRASSPRTAIHHHAFWQLELVTEGPIVVESKSRSLTLKTNDSVLIPPFVPHRFLYPQKECGWISCKFNVSGTPDFSPAQLFPSSSILSIPASTSPFSASLQQSIFNLSPFFKSQFNVLPVMEGLLSSFLSHHFLSLSGKREKKEEKDFNAPQSKWKHRLVPAIENYLRKHPGKRIFLSSLASALGYSPNHLSAVFRQETGQTIKQYLDEQHASTAKALLNYSEASISEISDQLSFPDVYSFSRFFKRVTGLRPKQYRIQQQNRN